jgi:ABC-type Fe3+ transport system substrate-binding protein
MAIRRSIRARSRVLPVLVALALTLAACGGGDAAPTVEPRPDVQEPAPDGELSEIDAAAAAAEANGLLFITSREELERLAAANGPLTGFVSSDLATELGAAFSAATGLRVASMLDFSGTDAYTRWLLEASAGAVRNLDIMQQPPEVYRDFGQYLARYDIYGMAEVGILNIPLPMIDPDGRNVVAVGSQIGGIAWNPNLISRDVIPNDWESFCDTSYLNGQTWFLDLRPSNIAPLVAEWGEERVLAMVECLAAGEPVLTRGTTDALTRMAAGEVAVHVFMNYHSCVRSAEKAGGAIMCGLIDPVPVRLSNALGVLGEGISNNPYAALLFIEWMTSPEAQAILDEDPLKSSIYAEGSKVALAVGNFSTSGGTIADYLLMDEWMARISVPLSPR